MLTHHPFWSVAGLLCLLLGEAYSQDKPVIIYTGSTLGYLRSNDSPGTAFLANYDDLIKGNHHPQAILVGTGDNFAPEYGARFDTTQNPIVPIARIRTNGTTATAWALSNKAVDFFRTPGHNPSKNPYLYDALVPGQYDFYFGAEFLRNIGEFTAEDDENRHPLLPMLGANLIVTRTSQPQTPQPLCAPAQLLLPTQVSLPVQAGGSQSGGKGKGGGGGGQGPSKSGQGGSKSGQGSANSGQTQACVQLPTPETSKPELELRSPQPDAVYPWTMKFEFALPKDINIDPQKVGLCLPNKNPNPYVFPGNCTLLDAKADREEQELKIYTYQLAREHIPIDADGSIDSKPNPPPDVFSEVKLFPGTDARLCVYGKKVTETQPGSICTALTVQWPMFRRAWVEVTRGIQSGVDGSIATKPDACNGNNSSGAHCYRYAIFGVLDAALQNSISDENSSWLKDGSATLKIKITDPTASLTQMVEAFKEIHSDTQDQWTYLVLAQMPTATAKVFAADLAYRGVRVDLVISAADRDQATPEMGLSIPKNVDDTQPVPAPVVTPYAFVEYRPAVPGKPANGVERDSPEWVVIDKSDASNIRYSNYTGKKAEACQRLFSEVLKKLDKFSRQQGYKTCDHNSEFECAALEAMRSHLDADLAVLQTRDFYDGCTNGIDLAALDEEINQNVGGIAVEEAVRRALWNSAFLTRVSLSGATLRVVLKASEDISQSEKSSIATSLAPNRDLIYLGVAKIKGDYYVDGVKLDDSKIYAAAISDQLVSGDTTYPQLAQIDLTTPDVFTGREHETFRVSDLVAQLLLTSYIFPAEGLKNKDVIAKWSAGKLGGDDPPTAAKKQNGSLFSGIGEAEEKVQDRNFFGLTLQQLAVGYSFSKPNQTDLNIGKNLAGVTNPNVASPHSENVSFSDNFRFYREYKSFSSAGLDEQLTFARNRQGTLQSSGGPLTTPSGAAISADSISLSANTLILSPFVEFHGHRYHPSWKWIVFRPATFSTDIAKNTQFLKTATKNVEYDLVLERQRNWQPSVGTRYEWDPLRFVEVGYLHQEATNVLSGLTLNGIFTPLTAGTTASSVANQVTPKTGDVAIPTFSTFHQDGAYLLWMYTRGVPLSHSKVVYQAITFGNFFAYGASARTSTSLTRYAVEFSNSLQVAIWGNLSLAPGFNLFYFQDQSHQVGGSLVRRDLTLQLNYLFDWHRGIAWRDALRGKSN